MSAVNSNPHSSPLHSSKRDNLESLVRTALLHKELAPGVAKQINVYRSEKLDGYKQRLLAILDDAIANQHIVIIQPAIALVTQQPAAVQTEHPAPCSFSQQPVSEIKNFATLSSR